MCNITADLRHEDHRFMRVFHDRPAFALRQGNMAVDKPAVDLFVPDAQLDDIAILRVAHPDGKVVLMQRDALDDPAAECKAKVRRRKADVPSERRACRSG